MRTPLVGTAGILSPTLTGGLVAGALDISYAIIGSAMLSGTSPQRVLQSVASGIYGKAAYGGGTGTAVAGLVLHFAMALTIAAIFVVVRARWPFLVRQPAVLVGPLYGVAVYFVMCRIIVPLSAAPLRDGVMKITFLDLAVHMFLVGLPIALAAQILGRRAVG